MDLFGSKASNRHNHGRLRHLRWTFESWPTAADENLSINQATFCGLLPIEMDFLGSERPPITIVMDDCTILDGLLQTTKKQQWQSFLAKYLDQTAFKDSNPITFRFDCNDQSNRLHSSNHAVNETNNKSNIWNCSSAPASFFSILAVTSTQNQQRTSNQRYNNAANHSSAITTNYPINYLGFYWKNVRSMAICYQWRRQRVFDDAERTMNTFIVLSEEQRARQRASSRHIDGQTGTFSLLVTVARNSCLRLMTSHSN